MSSQTQETPVLELEETSSENSVDVSDYWDFVFSPPPSTPPPLSPPPTPPPVHTLPKIENYHDFREIACGHDLITFAKFTKRDIEVYVPNHCDRAAAHGHICQPVSDKIKENIINEILETLNKK